MDRIHATSRRVTSPSSSSPSLSSGNEVHVVVSDAQQSKESFADGDDKSLNARGSSSDDDDDDDDFTTGGGSSSGDGGVIAYMALAKESTLRTMGTAAQPSRLARMWPWFTAAAACVGCGVVVALRNKEKWQVLAGWLKDNALDFWRDHVATPAREIIDELVFNRRTRITDVVALQDSMTSLQRMLFEFMRDTIKDMPLDEAEMRSKRLDMSVVSQKFELELPSAVWNLGFGEVARIMLIQVQFIKKELLVAMSAIEDLMDANNFNLFHSCYGDCSLAP
jgi:hypothetical protein